MRTLTAATLCTSLLCLSVKLATAQLPVEFGLGGLIGLDHISYGQSIVGESLTEGGNYVLPSFASSVYVASHPYEGFGYRAYAELGLHGWRRAGLYRTGTQAYYPHYAQLGLQISRTLPAWYTVGFGASLTRSRGYFSEDGTATWVSRTRKYGGYSVFVQRHFDWFTLHVEIRGALNKTYYLIGTNPTLEVDEFRNGIKFQLLIPLNRMQWLNQLERDVIIYSPRAY